ncbi:Nucleobase-ascorbate transporter 3 [Linum perenne]
MLGTIVIIASDLVPRMGGSHGDKARVIETLLFMAGINTLLQTLFGTRLPTVMGASFAYTLPVLSIIKDLSDENFPGLVVCWQRFVHTMRTIQGSLIVSSFVNIILGYSTIIGNLTKHFSAIVIVPVVGVVGLGLFARGFPLLANCVEIGLPMLLLLVFCQQYLKHLHSRAHPILERFHLLFCVGLVWAFAAILTVAGAYNNVAPITQRSCRTDRTFLISSAPWVRIPYPFQWGPPIFKASHVFGMMGASLVTAAEGVSLLIDGIFGTLVGTTASVENVGLLGLTHIGSRRVVQLSTAFMFFFAIFGKFGALFASIPLPIFAAIYCVVFGIVSATGISFMQFANSNSLRNHYVLGLSLFLGISIPQYFVGNTSLDGHGPVRTNGGWFDDILNTVFSSAPAVAIIVATILDNSLEREAVNDRGIPWLKPFQKRKGDVRTEEFYSLPLRIHEWLPTRFR